jgi:hypothetical protein
MVIAKEFCYFPNIIIYIISIFNIMAYLGKNGDSKRLDSPILMCETLFDGSLGDREGPF